MMVLESYGCLSGAKVEDLFHLDLAYAPPFSTTKDPVMYTGMILDNAIHRGRPLMTSQELDSLAASGEKYQLIDARSTAKYEKSHIEGAKSIPHAKLRATSESLDKERPPLPTVTRVRPATQRKTS